MTRTAAWALHTPHSLDDVNVHLAALQDTGLLGIVEQDGRATVYLARRADDLPLQGRWERIEERDWNAAWKATLEPVTVGDVTIRAPWHPPDDGATIELVIEPAQAFGTGHHETTTLCLAALQHVGVEGRGVLDVGTGTGVLAMAAAAAGAVRVVAVDTDPLAVTAAAANAAANGLAIEVVAGSVDEAGAERFDVVVANLDTATLSALAPALATCLAPGGTLIASGVSKERADEALAALQSAGLAATVSPGEDWAVLTAAPAGGG